MSVDHPDVIADSFFHLVCQDSCDTLQQNYFDELMSLVQKFGKFKVSNLQVENMQLPKLTNFGVSICETEKIVVLESDRIVPTGYYASVFDSLKPGMQVTCQNMRKGKATASDEDIRKGLWMWVAEGRSRKNELGLKNMWSGNTAFCRSDFEKAGRMDESYIGHGWADNDMTETMNSIGIESIYREEIEIHLWHPPFTYGVGDHQQLWINNGLHFCKKWKKPVPAFLQKDIAAKRKIML